ncbi:MAG: MFS transporter [Myxococcales bacterium]|nr:MFS transporter [Myxococcales bacterium]
MSRAEERRRSLRLSVVDGVLHAIMLGATESYLGALAVELGHRDIALSLLVTIPLAVGALSQLAGPRLVRWLGGEKRAVVAGVLLQAFTHLAFFAIAWTGTDSLAALLTAKIVYWASAASHAPAWSSWMARLVPARVRGRFFARRMWIYQVVLLAAFLGAGFWLDEARARGAVLLGFGALHLVSLVARLGSAAVLSRKSPFGEPPPRRRPALTTVLARGRWRVAVFVALLLAGAQLAVPFFTPYMLEELHLELGAFALLTSLSIAAKGISFPLWRIASTRFGARPVLAVSGALIASVPVFWFFSADLSTLAFAQLLGGVAWAGYELTSLQLLMGDAPEDGAVEFFALASALSGLTQVAGAIAGGWWLRTGVLGYTEVFLASAVARGAALLVLLFVPSPRRRVAAVLTRFASVRPSAGATATPLLPPPEKRPEETTPPKRLTGR